MTTELVEASAPELVDLSRQIHEQLEKGRSGLEAAFEAKLAIGHLLDQARALHKSHQGYGEWFEAQGFGFSTEWGRQLRTAAENEQAVRDEFASQLANGKDPSFTRALRALPRGNEPKEDETAKDEHPPCKVTGWLYQSEVDRLAIAARENGDQQWQFIQAAIVSALDAFESRPTETPDEFSAPVGSTDSDSASPTQAEAPQEGSQPDVQPNFKKSSR